MKKRALEWLITQHPEEVEYFLGCSETLRDIKRAVDLALPMPIAEEILPHLAALDGTEKSPEKTPTRVAKRDASPERKAARRK